MVFCFEGFRHKKSDLIQEYNKQKCEIIGHFHYYKNIASTAFENKIYTL